MGGSMTGFDDQGVSLTAVAVAAGRAVETSRRDPLMEDPFAALLVEAAHSHVDFPRVWPADLAVVSPLQHPLLLASIYIGVRTRFIDDFLLSGPTVQTVILGAGLDTRSHRLPWPPGSRVYEIDHANVLAFKADVLGAARATPSCELSSIEADLTHPWRALLLVSGFDPGQPTTWVLEGVLPYLDSTAQLAVLTEIVALSSPGSRAVIERAVPLPKTEEFEAKLREYSQHTGLPMNELLARADPPDPVQVLGAADWQCTAHTVQELCAAYGRTLSLNPEDRRPPEQAVAGQTRGGFVTAFQILGR